MYCACLLDRRVTWAGTRRDSLADPAHGRSGAPQTKRQIELPSREWTLSVKRCRLLARLRRRMFDFAKRGYGNRTEEREHAEIMVSAQKIWYLWIHPDARSDECFYHGDIKQAEITCAKSVYTFRRIAITYRPEYELLKSKRWESKSLINHGVLIAKNKSINQLSEVNLW